MICNTDEFGDDYRFGFNGQQKDNTIKGIGNSLDFGARIYDSRLGRWFSRDPMESKYPNYSTYTFAANNPLKFKDSDGQDVEVTIDDHSITFSSTIYIIGNGADALAKDANQKFN